MKHIVRAGLNPLIAAVKAALEYLIYGKQGRVLNYVIVKKQVASPWAIFLVYIPFFISHVPPAHSFFKKKSILKNLCQICGNLFFAAYYTPVDILIKENVDYV